MNNEDTTNQHLDNTDDTEAHAARSNHIGDASTEDTEAHVLRAGKGIASRHLEEADTEAHALKVHVDGADEGDLVDEADTEGHGARASHLNEADTEAHALKVHVDGADEGDLVDEADTEGHLYIPKDERAGGSDPGMSRGKGLAPAGEDDTEGHACRVRP